MKLWCSYIVLVVLGYASSCNNNQRGVAKNGAQSVNYIHVSHTRTAANPSLVSTIEKINFKGFEMRWLGGDLAVATSLDQETMEYVDEIFDVGNSNTLWSLGNHDYDDLKRVEKFTKRPAYYAYSKNKLTFIVLDTQDGLSSISGAQKKFFDGVIDTVQASSHVILLHHKLIWLYNNPALEQRIPQISNTKIGDEIHHINPNNFYSEIYPRLVKLKQNGIEVLCIAGDIGDKTKEFEHVTEDGIFFLASGISYLSGGNKALLFTHHIDKNQLTWEFKEISELLTN